MKENTLGYFIHHLQQTSGEGFHAFEDFAREEYAKSGSLAKDVHPELLRRMDQGKLSGLNIQSVVLTPDNKISEPLKQELRVIFQEHMNMPPVLKPEERGKTIKAVHDLPTTTSQQKQAILQAAGQHQRTYKDPYNGDFALKVKEAMGRPSRAHSLTGP